MEPSCERAPDALGQEQNECHEDDPDGEGPRLGPHADRVLEHEEGGGADEGTEECPGAAEERHDDDLARRRPVERLDRDHGQPQGVQRPRQATEHRVEDEREVLDARDVVAARRRTVGVLADRLQHGAERRVEDALERRHREADDHEREVVEDDRAVERQSPAAEADGGHRDTAQPVVAPRPVGEVEADEVEELGEGEREHREVDAAPPQAEEPDHGAADQREPESHPERQPQRGHLELGERDAGAVGAQPPVGGGAEREQPGVAVEQVEAEREEPVDEDLRGERLVRHHPREDRDDDEEAEDGMPSHPRRHAAHSIKPVSPSRPLGRKRSTSAMKMKTTISASLGAKNVVSPTIWPMSRPEMTAPSRLPMPPTTTTTNDSMMIVTPISAYAPRIGPARMPARPASPAPMPNTRNQIRPTSKPSARTISGSREPARMTSPMLVFSRKSQRPTSTAAVTAMTKSRYVGKYVKPRLTAPASAAGGSSVTPILPQMSRATSTSTSDSPKVSSSGSSGERP